PDTNPFPTPPFAFPIRGVGSRRGVGRPSVDGHANNSTGIRTAPTTSNGHSRAGDGFFTRRRPSTSHGRARDTAMEPGPSGNQDPGETISRNPSINRALDFTGGRSTRSRPSSSGGRRPSTTEIRAGDGFFSTSRRTVAPPNDRESARPATATLPGLSYSQDAPIPPTRSPPPDYEQFATAELKDSGIKG
ncbi:15766_t:CDS:1, partial [Acaulospora colombiana]